MSTARKTIPVGTVLDIANQMLRNSTDDVKDGRIATAIIIQDVLSATGNYKGFRYIDGNLGRTDDTRREYYRAAGL